MPQQKRHLSGFSLRRRCQVSDGRTDRKLQLSSSGASAQVSSEQDSPASTSTGPTPSVCFLLNIIHIPPDTHTQTHWVWTPLNFHYNNEKLIRQMSSALSIQCPLSLVRDETFWTLLKLNTTVHWRRWKLALEQVVTITWVISWIVCWLFLLQSEVPKVGAMTVWRVMISRNQIKPKNDWKYRTLAIIGKKMEDSSQIKPHVTWFYLIWY